MENVLVKIGKAGDIPSEYRGTPIALLLEYHNLNKEFEPCENPQILLGTCMDSRKKFHLPYNFAYIIRTGGANMMHSYFNISYAIAVGGVRYMALIGHGNCGMSGIKERKQQFIRGLVENAGWEKQDAEKHFDESFLAYEIGDETDFLMNESCRIRNRYPKIKVAPLLYNVEDNKLYCVK